MSESEWKKRNYVKFLKTGRTGEPRGLRARGCGGGSGGGIEGALRLVGSPEKRIRKQEEMKRAMCRGRDARGLGRRKLTRLTVRGGGEVASGGRNAFRLRASERPCQTGVVEDDVVVAGRK